MDWTKYLKQVETYIWDYPEPVRRQIIDDLYIYIRTQRRKNIPDEEILETLGSARDTADSIFMLHGDPAGYERPVRSSNPVRDTAQSFRDTWDSFTEFVQNGVKTVQKSLDGYEEEPPLQPVFTDVQPDVITIVSYRADLLLTILPGDEISYGFSTRKTLFSQPRCRTTIKEQNGGLLFRVICTGSNSPASSLTVTVPPYVEHVQIDNRYGRTVVRGLNDIHLLARQTSGSLLLEDLKTLSLTVQAGNAEIITDNVSSGEGYLETNNSAIQCSFFRGPLQMRSKHGAITLRGHSGGSLTCLSTKGSQNLETVSDTVSAETTSGRISLRMNGTFSSLYLKTGSGNIEAVVPQNSGTILFSSTRGKLINDTFLPVKRSRTLSVPMDDDPFLITIRTGSGRVHIH